MITRHQILLKHWQGEFLAVRNKSKILRRAFNFYVLNAPAIIDDEKMEFEARKKIERIGKHAK